MGGRGRKTGIISKSRGLKRPAAKAVSVPGATGKQAKKRGADSVARASAGTRSASAASASAERASGQRVTEEVEAVDVVEVKTGGDESDDILLSDSQLFWIRVEPVGEKMSSYIRKPFYVVAAASTRIYDLKSSIFTVHRIHHRYLGITHRGNSLRNKVTQGMYVRTYVVPGHGSSSARG